MRYANCPREILRVASHTVIRTRVEENAPFPVSRRYTSPAPTAASE